HPAPRPLAAGPRPPAARRAVRPPALLSPAPPYAHRPRITRRRRSRPALRPTRIRRNPRRLGPPPTNPQFKDGLGSRNLGTPQPTFTEDLHVAQRTDSFANGLLAPHAMAVRRSYVVHDRCVVGLHASTDSRSQS